MNIQSLKLEFLSAIKNQVEALIAARVANRLGRIVTYHTRPYDCEGKTLFLLLFKTFRVFMLRDNSVGHQCRLQFEQVREKGNAILFLFFWPAYILYLK